MHRFCFSSSPLGGVPLCPTRRRSDGQQNVGGDAHIAPQIPFPQIFRYAAGRIISAPTFTHTFSKRPGRRGRRPLQFVPADDVGSSGRPRAASPTIRFRSCCPNVRADNIRPYISAYVLPKAGTSRMAGRSRAASPTGRSGRSRKKPPPEGDGFALLEIEMIFDDIHDEQVHHCCAGCEKSAEYQDSCCGVVREIL